MRRPSIRIAFFASALFTLPVACGYNPHPNSGVLPCKSQCPGGYSCGADQLCWMNNQDGGRSDVGADKNGDVARNTDQADDVRQATMEAGLAETSSASSDAREVGAATADAAPDPCRGVACTQPSCLGLAATCGPSASGDCCASSTVPGGTFNRSDDANAPSTLSTFRLDTYAVTVGRFRNFVAAYAGGWRPGTGQGRNPNNPQDTGWNAAWAAELPSTLTPALACNALSTWTDSPGPSENRPIVCESWYEANAFCIWDGGRLATEAERNYAATGGNEQRVYPWSSPPSSKTIDSSYASYSCAGDGSAVGDCALTDLIVVGSKPKGNGKWGHADLAGNVLEWTQDFSANYVVPCNDCANLTNGTWRILGGSGYAKVESTMVSSYRFALDPIYKRNGDLGIRCARMP